MLAQNRLIGSLAQMAEHSGVNRQAAIWRFAEQLQPRGGRPIQGIRSALSALWAKSRAVPWLHLRIGGGGLVGPPGLEPGTNGL